MATRTVFYSFHYDRDVHRVQLVRNIGAIDGSPVLGSQEWETVRRNSEQAVVNWIDKQMAYKRAVVVLIGRETASRPWVKYEIKKAWDAKKPLVGIYIHGLSSMGVADTMGANPFDAVAGVTGIDVFDPTVCVILWAGSTPRPRMPTWRPVCPAGSIRLGRVRSAARGVFVLPDRRRRRS